MEERKDTKDNKNFPISDLCNDNNRHMNKRYIGKRIDEENVTPRDWRDDSWRYRRRRYPVTETYMSFRK